MMAATAREMEWEMIPRDVPILLCRTPAGFPSPAQDDMEEPIDIGAWLIEKPAASYLMRVDGHSMTGAGIHDGDLIVVSRAETPRAGRIVVALVHGDRTLKRLARLMAACGWSPKPRVIRTSSSTSMSRYGAW